MIAVYCDGADEPAVVWVGSGALLRRMWDFGSSVGEAGADSSGARDEFQEESPKPT